MIRFTQLQADTLSIKGKYLPVFFKLLSIAMGHLRSDRYNGVESQSVITVVHLDISIIIFTYLLDTLNSESMDMLVRFGRNKYALIVSKWIHTAGIDNRD